MCRKLFSTIKCNTILSSLYKELDFKLEFLFYFNSKFYYSKKIVFDYNKSVKKNQTNILEWQFYTLRNYVYSTFRLRYRELEQFYMTWVKICAKYLFKIIYLFKISRYAKKLGQYFWLDHHVQNALHKRTIVCYTFRSFVLQLVKL